MSKQGEKTQAAVLSLLKQSGKPMKAYDILAAMKVDNAKLAPPTIYRALAALTERGRAHRIESANAYMACSHDHAHDQAALIAICENCGAADERVDAQLVEQIAQSVDASGFKVKRQVVEVYGTCPDCMPEGHSG